MTSRPQEFAWTPLSKLSIKEFTAEHRPSNISTEESPWLWAQADGPFVDPEMEYRQEDAVQEAKDETDRLFDRIMEIDNDENIPLQRGKVASKAELKKQAYDRSARLLKVIICKTKWTSGKWLWRSDHHRVDQTWERIASSVVAGPLKEAGVTLAKVETGNSKKQHQLYLYLSDVFNAEAVVQILETLISCHGVIPAGVKPDLYTAAGITSQHPSKIDSLVFRPRNHPQGLFAIDRLKREFDEYEAIFGPGSRMLDLLDTETDIASSPTRVGDSPNPPAGIAEPLKPHISLQPKTLKTGTIFRDVDRRPIKPLPLRFRSLISLAPTGEPQSIPRGFVRNIMKDFERVHYTPLYKKLD